MSLSLVYRAARPSLLANPAAHRVSLTALSIRHGSLSAIHRGVFRSEKAQGGSPQGARSGRTSELAEGAKRMTYAERQKAREQLAKERPDYKIRRGKKDITEYPDKARPQSRRARFYDPESSFGKKSRVFQMKAGSSRDEFKAPHGRGESQSSSSAFERTGPRPELRPPPRRTVRRMARGRDSRGGKDDGDVTDLVAELSRPAGSSRAPPRQDTDAPKNRDAPSRDGGATRGDKATFGARDAPRRDGGAFRNRDARRRDVNSFPQRDTPGRDRDAPRRDMNSFQHRDALIRDRDAPRQNRDQDAGLQATDTPKDQDSAPTEKPTFRDRGTPRRDFDRGDRDTSRPDRDAFRPKRDRRDPISIPYTTAASQFLYGKSVVEAALRSTRRQLYKLYIYGGANRQNTSDNALIQRLAQRKGIPTTEIHDGDGLRLMDKMSGSRPHNGFVLEASALPQPPLTALGPLAEDYPTNPVYPVTLGHQSAEEAAINGTPATIPAPSASHKPLVVALDQILDPGNLGAILRTVSFLGATAVGITRKGSATLTPVALKASAGASETLTLFSIPALPDFLNASRANGWAVYAAVAASPGVKQRRHMDLHDVEEADPLRKEPCVLLVGNEGEGLSRLTVKKADYEVNIPNFSGGGSGVDSLNVSVAVGLLCSAFLRGVVREVEGLGVGRIGQGQGGEGEEAKVKEFLW